MTFLCQANIKFSSKLASYALITSLSSIIVTFLVRSYQYRTKYWHWYDIVPWYDRRTPLSALLFIHHLYIKMMFLVDFIANLLLIILWNSQFWGISHNFFIFQVRNLKFSAMNIQDILLPAFNVTFFISGTFWNY